MPNGFMAGGLTFSPDGKWLPEIETTTDPATQLASHKIVLLNVSTNAEKPAKYIGARPDIFSFVRVTPDGRSVDYVVVENGVSNVWSQCIDGSKGHWLTNFTADQITTLQFSPDGKYLAIGGSHVISKPSLPPRLEYPHSRAASSPARDLNSGLRSLSHKDIAQPRPVP